MDCLLPTNWSTPRSVIRQTIVIGLPFLVLFAFWIFWATRRSKKNQDKAYLLKRCILTALVVLYISYISLTKAAINVFYCVDVYDATILDDEEMHPYWAIDTAVRCFEGSHMKLLVFVAIPLLLFTLLFPILLAMTLINARRRNKLTSIWMVETMGLFFRGFEEKYIFWDSIILLRKALLAAIVVFAYSLGGNLQGLLAVCVLVLSLFLQTRLDPFKECLGNLNQLESVSLLVSSLTFLTGVILNDAKMTSGLFEVFLVVLAFVCNVGLALLLFYLLVHAKVKQIRFCLQADGVDCQTSNGASVVYAYILLCIEDLKEKVKKEFSSSRSNKEIASEDPAVTQSAELAEVSSQA